MPIDTISSLKSYLRSRSKLKICILDNNMIEVLTRASSVITQNYIYAQYDIILIPGWVYEEVQDSEVRVSYINELQSRYNLNVYIIREKDYSELIGFKEAELFFITDHGKQLAESFPEETYRIYEEFIQEEAKEAKDRGKYKNVCRIIKNFYEAGAKFEAIEIINQLNGMYQRRPAMIEELAGLKKKLSK